MKNNKNSKKNKDYVDIINCLSESKKREYLRKSKIMFISLCLSLVIDGLFLSFLFIYASLHSNGYHLYKSSGLCVVLCSLLYLISYLKKSKEEKIIEFFKIVFNEKTQNKKMKNTFWCVEIMMILVLVALPMYHMFFSVSNKIIMGLITLSGVFVSFFTWYALLSKKKSVEKELSNNENLKNDNVK